MILANVAWAVDIGRTSLKAVRMQRIRDTVEITGVDVIDYYGSSEEPPSASEVRQALAQFKQRNKVKGSDCVCVAVPGYSTFSRFVKLSPVEDKKMSDIVQYEAAQQIPFPLSDVVWEFQKVEREYAEGEEVEAGLFAIKKEIVDRFLSHFDAVRLHIDLLTVAPLALYNFVRHEMDVPENAVVVDIGADHTDLVIMHGSKFYVRNLPLAGNDITRALKEKFELSFGEAEKLKIKAAKSKQAEKIFSVMQPVLREFVSEISRSLGFYKSQAGNASFEHLVLLGNASKLEGLAKYFAANLDVKIHRFYDIVHMELSRDLDLTLLEEHLPSFAVAMGLALQALGKGKYSINLIPAQRRSRRIIARKKPLLLGSVSLLFLLLLFMFLADSSRTKATESAISQADEILNDYGNLTKKLAEAKKYDDLEKKGEELVAITKARNIPIDVLNNFNSVIPANLNRLPEELLAGFYESLPPNIDAIMDEVNKEKIWLLGLNFTTQIIEEDVIRLKDKTTITGTILQRTQKDKDIIIRTQSEASKTVRMDAVEDVLIGGREELNVEFTGAVQFDLTEVKTREKVVEKIAQKIAEKFNTTLEKLMESPADKIIKSLSLDPKLSGQTDGSKNDYFKFILRWSVPLHPGFKKVEEVPKKAPKAK